MGRFWSCTYILMRGHGISEHVSQACKQSILSSLAWHVKERASCLLSYYNFDGAKSIKKGVDRELYYSYNTVERTVLVE